MARRRGACPAGEGGADRASILDPADRLALVESPQEIGPAGLTKPAGRQSRVHRDGNGWVTCEQGHRHWGLHGAAGLLVANRDANGQQVLLQLRAQMSHHGGTWGVPGGARDSHEGAVEAALREAAEETTLDLEPLVVLAEQVDDHGGWSYVTVLARSPTAPLVEPLAESDDVAWFELDDVDDLELHPGFEISWPTLRVMIEFS
jgi:8-oxo-dGTP diphosphatase